MITRRRAVRASRRGRPAPRPPLRPDARTRCRLGRDDPRAHHACRRRPRRGSRSTTQRAGSTPLPASATSPRSTRRRGRRRSPAEVAPTRASRGRPGIWPGLSPTRRERRSTSSTRSRPSRPTTSRSQAPSPSRSTARHGLGRGGRGSRSSLPDRGVIAAPRRPAARSASVAVDPITGLLRGRRRRRDCAAHWPWSADLRRPTSTSV
jgi:hypothetical protein